MSNRFLDLDMLWDNLQSKKSPNGESDLQMYLNIFVSNYYFCNFAHGQLLFHQKPGPGCTQPYLFLKFGYPLRGTIQAQLFIHGLQPQPVCLTSHYILYNSELLYYFFQVGCGLYSSFGHTR